MKFTKFYSRIVVVTSFLFISGESGANIAEVYCTTRSGSRALLKSDSRPVIYMLGNNTILQMYSYNIPFLASGTWKKKEVGNQNINYFLIDGGQKIITRLQDECKQKIGSDYIYAHPYYYSLPNSEHYFFGYLSENGSDQIDKSDINKFSN